MHFTYSEKPDQSTLKQGDLISRTKEIEALLQEVHPHYYKKADDYRFFQVLTQTCDLVRRDGSRCEARYITLAAARPLELAVRRHVEKFQDGPEMRAGGFCEDRAREKVKRFVEHLLTNEESDYFYLHGEPNNGLQEAHCTFLALSIAVRANEHYEKILAAKLLELTEPFQHKLGWLVGQMYSRIGTEDWKSSGKANEFTKLVESILNENVGAWVTEKERKLLLARLQAVGGVTPQLVREILPEIRKSIPSRMTEAVNALNRNLDELGLPAETTKKIVNSLRSDPEFSRLLKAAK